MCFSSPSIEEIFSFNNNKVFYKLIVSIYIMDNYVQVLIIIRYFINEQIKVGQKRSNKVLIIIRYFINL